MPLPRLPRLDRLPGLASRVKLAVGSAVTAFADPERGDMVATLGEVTGNAADVCRRMLFAHCVIPALRHPTPFDDSSS